MTATGRTSRSWIPIFVVLVVLGAVAAVGAWRGQPTTESIQPVEPNWNVVTRDSFGRDVHDGLGRTRDGHEWRIWSGGWQVTAVYAHIVDPIASGSMAALEVGTNASIRATIGGSGNCGVIAAADASGRRLELVQQPLRGMWSLQWVDGGDRRELATLPVVPGIATNVIISVGPDEITARVGSGEASAKGVAAANGEFAGLIGYGATQTQCSFDDVIVFVPKG